MASQGDERVFQITGAVIDLAEHLKSTSLYWLFVFGGLRRLKDLLDYWRSETKTASDSFWPWEPWITVTFELLGEAVHGIWNQFQLDRVVAECVNEDTGEFCRFQLHEWDWPKSKVPETFRHCIRRSRRALTSLPRLDNWDPDWTAAINAFRATQRRRGLSPEDVGERCRTLKSATLARLVRSEISSQADADECQWEENSRKYWPAGIQDRIGENWLYWENLDGLIPLRTPADVQKWLVRMQRMMHDCSYHSASFPNTSLPYGIAAVRDGRRWLKHLSYVRVPPDPGDPETVRAADRSIETLLSSIESEGSVVKRHFAVDVPQNDIDRILTDVSNDARQPEVAVPQDGSVEESHADPVQSAPKKRPFDGGSMVFYVDRVELCGIDICSGPRSKSNRRILDLLREKKRDGQFMCFSGKKLAACTGRTISGASIGGKIRDLRTAISRALQSGANIECSLEDVIQSSAKGYKFSSKLTVQVVGSGAITDIPQSVDVRDVRETLEDHGQSVRDDVRDSPVDARRKWILRELADERLLKAQDVVANFKVARKTAERDLQKLVADGEIAYIGSRRSGHYSLRKTSRKHGKSG